MAEAAKKRPAKKTTPVKAEAEELRPVPEEEALDDPQYKPPKPLEDPLSDPIEFLPILRHEERLQKIIASAGVTSRRKAEELITEGRVVVNGQVVVELGAKADAAQDHIRVDGKLLAKPGQGANRLRYAMLNKPKGYITSASDPEGRPTVMKFFPGAARVYPVGRLDYQSEGLLLMTNDGDLANRLTRAANKVQKVYLVKISRKPSDEAIAQLRAGIMIDKGRNKDEKLGRVLTQPAGIRCVRDAENPWYEVTLTEGRNREIRKMFEEVGHFVEKIRRVGYGPLVLDIEPGEVRELSPDEILALQRSARGLRTRSSMAVPPVSVPPLQRKAKRGAGASDRAKPVRKPILSEWPTKPARPAATRPEPAERLVSTRPAAPTGRSFNVQPATSRPSTGRPSSDRTFSDQPAGRRPTTDRPASDRPSRNRPIDDRAGSFRPTSNRPPSARAAGERPTGARPTDARSTGSAKPSTRPESFGPKKFGAKPSTPKSFERPAPKSRPSPSESPDLPETPSFGITITREPGSSGKSFNDRPGKGRPTGGSPFGARRPGVGRPPNRASSGSATGFKGGPRRPTGRPKANPKSGPRSGR